MPHWNRRRLPQQLHARPSHLLPLQQYRQRLLLRLLLRLRLGLRLRLRLRQWRRPLRLRQWHLLFQLSQLSPCPLSRHLSRSNSHLALAMTTTALRLNT
jgi:hypothetical protein